MPASSQHHLRAQAAHSDERVVPRVCLCSRPSLSLRVLYRGAEHILDCRGGSHGGITSLVGRSVSWVPVAGIESGKRSALVVFSRLHCSLHMYNDDDPGRRRDRPASEDCAEAALQSWHEEANVGSLSYKEFLWIFLKTGEFQNASGLHVHDCLSVPVAYDKVKIVVGVVDVLLYCLGYSFLIDILTRPPPKADEVP
ncbi:hypothetical protein OSTOST_24504 [Ostertagia ostertagi]